jgi:hypothetical protein
MALVFFFGSSLVFGLSVWELKNLIDHSYDMNDLLGKISTPVNGFFFALNVLQLAISLPAIVSSVSLLFLRDWARNATIGFATAAAAGSALAISFFLAEGSSTGLAGLAAGVGFLIYGVAFLVFLPPSIWAWLVLTGDRAKSQFFPN